MKLPVKYKFNKLLLYLRLISAIIGLFIFYSFIHEFAYRHYRDVSPATADTLLLSPDSSSEK